MRKTMPLPEDDALLQQIWTYEMQELADFYGIDRRTMSFIIDDRNLRPPPRGYWSKSGRQRLLLIPDEIKRLFPPGPLPLFSTKDDARGPFGFKVKLPYPDLTAFLKLLWMKQYADIAIDWHCGSWSVNSRALECGLPTPRPKYWKQPISARVIPDQVKRLFTLSPTQLLLELNPDICYRKELATTSAETASAKESARDPAEHMGADI